MSSSVVAGVDVDEARPSGFDPPRAGQGTLFPLSGGMLQAANIREDLLTGAVVSAEGRSSFLEALKAFDSGELDVRLLDLLCCNGCIMGAGMSSKAPYFRRRALISRYAQRRVASRNGHGFSVDHNRLLAELSLSCSFQSRDQMAYEPNEHDIREIMSRMGKSGATDELDCGACGYETCREHAMAIFNGLAESEMCLPYTIEQLKHTCDELTRSHSELESTQEALMQAEKLASMGQLAAGIAHEVNNPLGTVLMLSHLMLEDTREDDENRADLELMASEALRCKKIVSGLLQFARKNKVDASSIDLQGLLERFAATVRDRSGVEIAVERRIDNARAEVDADQIMQVIVNLGSNALDAMGGKGTLTLATDGDDEQIQVIVSDTGCGIPASLSKKIFEPFFTTKHSGQGTGLGLSVTYGIVKMHHGDIRMQSNDDPAKGPLGTTFTVTMPRRRRPKEEVALATANGAGPAEWS
jgi:two-component system NtrC family sensor kinase